jgi:D-amino peptidase
MSKVYISCDLEGVSGVVNRDHTSSQGHDYGRARKLMTAEVNSAIEGAFEGGASYVLVNDAHGSMTNILIEDLDDRAELLTGSPKPLTQMQGIDETFSLCAFIGYHARRDTLGAVLEHTISGSAIREICINGKVVGETEINMGIAGHFGVPVGLVAGDNIVTQQAREAEPAIETVVVKYAEGRYSARCLHPTKAKAFIKTGMKKAVSEHAKFKPYVFKTPVEFKISFINTSMAELAEMMPTSERIGASSVRLINEDFVAGFKAVRAMIHMCRAVIRR